MDAGEEVDAGEKVDVDAESASVMRCTFSSP